MNKIYFITSGSIDYQLPGLSLYESIRKTALGEEFPCLNEQGKKEVLEKLKEFSIKPTLIITAPSCQCKETAQILADFFVVPIEEDHDLLPLRFDISNYLTEEDFTKGGKKSFDIMRNRFLNDFFTDVLIDSNKEVKRRYGKFQKISLSQNKTILFVSHAFLIQLLLSYDLKKDLIYKDSKVLKDLFDPNNVPLGRLKLVELTF